MTDRIELDRIYNRVKLRIPLPGRGLVARSRLIDRLEEHRHSRLTMLQAPAGYGKSILLQQWAERLRTAPGFVVWFSMDASDREATSFLAQLLLGFEEAGAPVGATLSSVLRREKYVSWQLLAATLANSLFDYDMPIHVLLDDAHYLKDAPAAECLQLLLEAAPPNLHFVVASRHDFSVPLGRARALGQVLEIRTDDLRFLPGETNEFLVNEGHVDLPIEQRRYLQERSEGWIVGLKLLSMSLRADPQQARQLVAVTGDRRQIADFFSEDVLSRQTLQLREFLLRTAVLDRFCPAMSDYVLDTSDSRTLIDEIEAAGLFLVPLDETRTWYRYQHLFAEYLIRCLEDQSRGERSRLYLKAATWLVNAGHPVEGFDYALRGNNALRAAEILEASCDSMWRAGQQEAFQRMAARVPPHIQALHPRIMLAIAWRLCMQWQLTEARNLVDVSHARIAELHAGAKSEASELEKLSTLVAHRESQLAHANYEILRLEDQCLLLSRTIRRTDDPYILASFYNSQQYAEREQYKLSRVGRLSELALAEIQRTGSRHNQVFHAAITGPSYLLAGRTEDAMNLLNDGLQIAEQIAGRGSPLGAVAAIPLAHVCYELNDVSRATQLMDVYLPATNIGFVDQLVSGCVVQARLQCLAGKAAEALKTLDDAVEFARRHDINRLETVAHAESIWVLMRGGRPDDAVRHARAAGLLGRRDADALVQNRKVTRLDGLLATVWCRVAAIQDRLGEAVRVARFWRNLATNAGAVYEAVRWDILLSELLLISGDRMAARRSLGQAVAKAAGARLQRPFLDQGEPIAQMLLQMSAGGPDEAVYKPSFVKELVNAFRQELQHGDALEDQSRAAPAALCGRMRSREIQILELAATGMPNLQIGLKLGLTEGSIKWYLQQIFDKVGVRDRFLAVQKARELGLMK
jgi:LuxR family maltose regulon positive regulatory protein